MAGMHNVSPISSPRVIGDDEIFYISEWNKNDYYECYYEWKKTLSNPNPLMATAEEKPRRSLRIATQKNKK